MCVMSGQQDIEEGLRDLSPRLDPTVYVFASGPWSLADVDPWCPVATVVEAEGLSVVIPHAVALRENIASSGPFRRITLEMQTSLEAVGITAVVSTCLARWGIAANVIAGAFHDHILVPSDRAEEAMDHLRSIDGRPSAMQSVLATLSKQETCG